MKLLSFTFDDALLNSARKAAAILSPYKATFFIPTGWVRPNASQVHDTEYKQLDHGSISDWRLLHLEGHDIQSHTVSHPPLDWFESAQTEKITAEYDDSLKTLMAMHSGPYILSTPYYQMPKLEYSRYDAVRVGEVINGERKSYNDLKNLKLPLIRSYIPPEDDLVLPYVPDNSWLVVSLHGLDGDGWHPYSSTQLRNFLSSALTKGFKIMTMREVLTSKLLSL